MHALHFFVERIIKVVFMSKIYMKKVNLIGYKTFSKAATVELQKNLNIVFGPSGCGKSNLFSAINWVLLDNNTPKEFVDKILFQGNEEVQKADFAEVSLFYGEKCEPSDEDIIITHRLERNGKESFFIKNKRLSDFESFKEQVSRLNLPTLCILDNFDKNKKHCKTSKIYSDIAFRSQCEQTVVVLYRNKNIHKFSIGGLIGISHCEGTTQTYCMNIVL